MKAEPNEFVWQKALKRFFCEHNGRQTYKTQYDKDINILSMGEHNLFSGPDFKNACFLLENEIVVGDIEFHQKSSSWLIHKHFQNEEYKNVKLHIVFENDKKFDANFETLVFAKNELLEYLEPKLKSVYYDYLSYSDFQQYAVKRLQRKSNEVKSLLQTISANEALHISCASYLKKYFSSRRRPVYETNYSNKSHTVEKLIQKIIEVFQLFLLNDSNNSYKSNNLYNNNNSYKPNIFERLEYFLNLNDFTDLKIGKHLKTELIVNSILPWLLCFSDKTLQEEIAIWYLTAKTNVNYGILTRKYPLIKQEYIWQQQGMLEHYKEFF